MDAIATSLLVAALVFAAGFAGLHLHRVVPAQHLSQDTQDVVRLGTGMMSVLASLVLGLLIATVKTSFDATETSVRGYGADLIVLDETLRDYGDTALASRRLLRNYTGLLLRDAWPDRGGDAFMVEHRDAGELMERVRESIRALTPDPGGQRWLMDQALEMSTSLLRQRWLMIERSGPSVRPVVIGILVSWIMAIFVSFGLNAPRNAIVQAAFLVCSLAIGSSIFIVLQLDSPFAGVMRISSQPIRTALEHMVPVGR